MSPFQQVLSEGIPCHRQGLRSLPRSEELDRLRTWKPSMDPITGRCDPALSPSGSRGPLPWEEKQRTRGPDSRSLFSQWKANLARSTRGTLDRSIARYNKHHLFLSPWCFIAWWSRWEIIILWFSNWFYRPDLPGAIAFRVSRIRSDRHRNHAFTYASVLIIT